MPFPTSSLAQSGRFSHIREIGRGASGLMYYAKDNLGRDVAVKEALPSHQSFQSVREKFEKESRLQASLQHPNIIGIYHLETDQQTGELYLICEYANGGSLADYLQRHGLFAEADAIRVARDICTALVETWRHQIVHRDIKPSNILLTTDAQGQIVAAKLGDFGIAQDQRMRRTTILPGTSSPGTPLYAAPEQHDPKNIVDVRADIYALGITLWEMLTLVDYKPLVRPNVVPNLRDYNTATSLGIAEVIRRAVQDTPSQRYPSPQAMASDLKDVLEGRPLGALATQSLAAVAAPTVRVSQPPQRGRRASIVGLVGIGIALMAALALWRVAAGGTPTIPPAASETNTPAPSATSMVALEPTRAPEPTSTASGAATQADSTVPSPSALAETATRPSSATPTTPPGFIPLAQDTGACWTPTGCQELRLGQGRLYAYNGERVDNFCNITLLPDAGGSSARPWVVCQAIGEPTPSPTNTREPVITATRTGSPTATATATASPTRMATPRPVTKIAFASEGHIFVINDDGSGRTDLTPGGGYDYYPSWSPDGRIAFTSNRSGTWAIYVMNGDGSDQRLLVDNAAFPAWSPDGKTIAFSSNRDGNGEIYIVNADGSGQIRRLTDSAGEDDFPAWSPDNQRIVFSSKRDGATGEIYVMNTDGSGQTRLTNNDAEDLKPAWSPDGRRIAFSSNRDDKASGEIYVMDADGARQMRLTDNAAVDGHPSWSPDGAHIVFYSERDSGDRELYIMRADGSQQTRLTNHGGDDWWPNWRWSTGVL